MKDREQQLLKLGFENNPDQQTFYKDSIYVDYHKIREYENWMWIDLIEYIEAELKGYRIDVIRELRSSEGYNFAQKEIKQKIKDRYNDLNSKLKEETNPKLTKRLNLDRIQELEIQVKLLKELMDEGK